MNLTFQPVISTFFSPSTVARILPPVTPVIVAVPKKDLSSLFSNLARSYV